MKSTPISASIAGLALFLALAPLAASLPVAAHTAEDHHSVRTFLGATSFLASRRDVKGMHLDSDAEANAVIQAAEAAEATGSFGASLQDSVSASSASYVAKASSKTHKATKRAGRRVPAADEKADTTTEEEADDADESSEDEAEDEEKSAEVQAPAPAAPASAPAAPARARMRRKASPAPAPASKEEDDDDEEEEEEKKPVVGYQAPVVAVVTIKNVDYYLLAEDQSVHAAVEAAVREAIAAEAGDDVDSDDVSIVSWSGSIRARAVIKPTEGVSSEFVVSELQNSSLSLSTSITERVSGIVGIESATKGIISCDIDVLVANMVSSVSKVMSRAKGHEHLGRVYELEQQAAEAREEITDIVAEEQQIDVQIKDIEDEKTFTKMVDERVKEVKGELQAPVFAKTMGDMWKDMRRFGAPCLLKSLLQQKTDMKVRIADAERNATVVEQELQAARDDVKETWYPTPPKPKSAATFGSTPPQILVAVGVAFFALA